MVEKATRLHAHGLCQVAHRRAFVSLFFEQPTGGGNQFGTSGFFFWGGHGVWLAFCVMSAFAGRMRHFIRFRPIKVRPCYALVDAFDIALTQRPARFGGAYSSLALNFSPSTADDKVSAAGE
jgi:hypothetical protein